MMAPRGTHPLAPRVPATALTTALAVALACAACGSPGPGANPAGTSAPTVRPTVRPTAAGPSASPTADELPVGDEPVTLDPSRFTADVTHPYWPMKPGTRWTYREVDDEGSVQKVVTVATTKTKRIANGVTARVVRDTVYLDGAVIEDTYDWYAQDDAGNVWYLGEETAEFDNGKVVSRKGSFEAGVGGAQAGILLPARPAAGQRYRQEYLEGEAEDNGEILRVGERVETAAGSWEDAVLTRDTITNEPDVVEYKLYARGVGLALAMGVSGGSTRESLVTVDQAPATAGTGPLGTPNP